MRKWNIGISGVAILAVACELGMVRGVVAQTNFESPAQGVLAITGDTETLVAVDDAHPAGHKLVAFETAHGQEIGRYPYNLAGDWEVVAVTADDGNDADVWSLHDNGYQIQWSVPDFSIVDWTAPISGFSGDAHRLYCDMDRTSKGVVYISTEEDDENGVISAYVYRLDNGQWTRAHDVGPRQPLTKCSQVSYDSAEDEVVVLEDGDILHRLDADDLRHKGTAFLPGPVGFFSDLAVIGHKALLSGIGTHNGWGQLLIASTVTGDVEDSTVVLRPEAVVLEPINANGELFGWYAGSDTIPVKYTASRIPILE